MLIHRWVLDDDAFEPHAQKPLMSITGARAEIVIAGLTHGEYWLDVQALIRADSYQSSEGSTVLVSAI